MKKNITQYLKILFILALLIVRPIQAIAGVIDNGKQQADKRMTIGLVLSGGGARGFAHIGVIEWFEQHHIPVDYMSGTSIGGLVGALYAMGMTPQEMREFLKTVDWDLILQQGTSYQNLSFRRKEDRSSFKTDFEFGLSKGITLPEGLSSAHHIGLVLDRVTLPYSALTSFDQLPIPFRCMAADFVTAKPVVLKDGPLTTAMRATMSLPGIFPPVQRDGKILVDGGLLNNIPTDVMRQELKPDIVIAVDIGTPLNEVESRTSLFGVLQQSLTVILVENDRRNLRLADLILAPELGNLSILDFSSIDETIEKGYQACKEKAAILQRFAISETEWQDYLARRNSRKKTISAIPDSIAVTGVDKKAQQELSERLTGLVGRPLEIKELEKTLTEIVGEGRYESIGYELLPASQDATKTVLSLRVKDKSYAPSSLNIGVDLGGSDVNDINFSIGGRLTLYDIGRYGSELRNDLKVGFSTRLASEYYYPISNQNSIFLATRGFFTRDREDIFDNGNKIAVYRFETEGIGLDLTHLTRRSELRFGYEIGRSDASVRIGAAPLPTVKGRTGFTRLRFAFDGLNSGTVPTAGTRLIAEARYYDAAPTFAGKLISFPQANFEIINFKPFSERSSLIFNAAVGTTFNRDAGPVQNFTIGGPFRLSAYGRNEFRGSHFVLGSLGYLRQISQISQVLGGKIFLIGFYEAGGAFQDITDPRVRSAITGGLIIDSKVGPVSILGSAGEGGRFKFYFTFGKFF